MTDDSLAADRIDRLELRLEKGVTRLDSRVDRFEERVFAKLDAMSDDIAEIKGDITQAPAPQPGTQPIPTAGQNARAALLPAGTGALAAGVLSLVLNWLQTPGVVVQPAPTHAPAPQPAPAAPPHPQAPAIGAAP